MAQLSERTKTLAKFATSEAELKQLRALGHEEATWRINHEMKVHIEWAQERAIFMQAEMPPAPSTNGHKPTMTIGPPIVTHRNRNGAGFTHTTGEKYT
jgi:nicotinic acid phosphoribosyltransferase